MKIAAVVMAFGALLTVEQREPTARATIPLLLR